MSAKNIIALGLIIGLLFSFAAPAQTQEISAGQTQEMPKEKKEVVSKTVSGVVSGISPNFIAVMYGQDEKGEAALEMAFNVDKNVKIEHKSSFKEISFGDTVTVTYDEETVTVEGKASSSKRIAKAITFVRQAQPRPEASENASLVSDQAPLPIKGLKKGD